MEECKRLGVRTMRLHHIFHWKCQLSGSPRLSSPHFKHRLLEATQTSQAPSHSLGHACAATGYSPQGPCSQPWMYKHRWRYHVFMF